MTTVLVSLAAFLLGRWYERRQIARALRSRR